MKPIKFEYRRVRKCGPVTPSFELTNHAFKNALESFRKNIITLGYKQRSCVMFPSCTREFLFRIEEKGIRGFRDITPEHINEHYEYLNQRPNFLRKKGGLSSTYINQHVYSLRLFFSYLEVIGLIKKNPISGLSFDRLEYKEREVLSIEEIMELYEVTETLRDKAILSLYYGCGLRHDEGSKLNIRDINFRTSILYVREGKGRKRRTIPMAKRVVEDLRNYYLNERRQYIKKISKDNQVAFLLNYFGDRMSGISCNNRLQHLIQKTGNPNLHNRKITLHNLRHSIATHLLENGLSIFFVRDFLGHEVISSTEVYVKVSKKLLKTI